MNTLFSEIHTPGKKFFGSRDDFIFMRKPNGVFAVGKGPFTLMRNRLDNEPAFYFNDFTHRFENPWIRPYRFYEKMDIAELLEPFSRRKRVPLVAWRSPSKDTFRRLFDIVAFYLAIGVVSKLVPVICEEGWVIAGCLEGVLCSIDSVMKSLHPYGIRIGDSGMIGASPEPIVSIKANKLTSVALAGTVSSQGCQGSLIRDKEWSEHRIVADFIASTLADYGEAKRSPVGRLHLGSMDHLVTTFESDLASSPDIESMIRALHPTPAVGPFPRSARTLHLAEALRRRANVPRAFAAPFGVATGDEFDSLLTIRNVIWRGNHIRLPAGCGLVQGSDFEEEWEELRLKRESVKAVFNLSLADSSREGRADRVGILDLKVPRFSTQPVR